MILFGICGAVIYQIAKNNKNFSISIFIKN